VRRPAALIAAAVIAVAVVEAAPAAAASPSAAQKVRWQQRVRDAVQFLHSRAGAASFAVVDEGRRVHGRGADVPYSSASLVKAMLLVAYLQRRDVRNRKLRGSERQLLAPMIRVSNNDAATAVYERVGPDGLVRLARRAGMRGFVPNPVWGGCQVTARDQARFFSRIRRLVPRPHRRYALGLLRGIVSYQRWGIPQGAPRGWRLYFKGGWFQDDEGWRVHQAARLERGGRRLSIAVLTRGNPSLDYGAATIAGVTSRLLHGV
jgi:Beta-lactamase enzyme family